MGNLPESQEHFCSGLLFHGLDLAAEWGATCSYCNPTTVALFVEKLTKRGV
jgi:hypothetical protein